MRKEQRDEEFHPEMPLVEAEHLLSYLFEIGPTLSVGMGEAPLTHAEIAAWQVNTGVELASWEARFLQRLSLDYLVQAQSARLLNCAAPWREWEAAAGRAVIAKSVQASIRALVNL